MEHLYYNFLYYVYEMNEQCVIYLIRTMRFFPYLRKKEVSL